MRTYLFASLLVIALTAPAISAEEEGPQARTFIKGSTCGQIITDIEKRKDRKQLALMVGSFISGSNYAKKRKSMMSLTNMMALTEKFCHDNPDKPIIASLVTLDRVIDKQIELARKKAP